MLLMIGGFLGFFSVAFGAFAEHGLKPNITSEQFRFVMTAIRYNQINSLIISSIGLFLISQSDFANPFLLKSSAYLFIIGTILFSFSIYLSVILKNPTLTSATPFGGIIIMIAWLLLSLVGVLSFRSSV